MNEDKGLDLLSAITRDRSAAKRSYQMDAGGGNALKPPPANMRQGPATSPPPAGIADRSPSLGSAACW
ncbi:MAG TPA: hypothetical protein VGP09_17905, partial [Caballeronia sp.]|nr:hypothetical protein [Caballeronia sp.]